MITELSSYVTGCCDNKIYKIKSNTMYSVGNLLISQPINFCYKVIQEPQGKVYFSTLNDDIPLIDVGSGKTCSYSGCLPCPPITPEPTPLPPPPIPGVSYNECSPITLLPLGAECVAVNPNIYDTTSGILSLNITGGTAPYKVVWLFPDNTLTTGTTIYNLSAGIYTATVTDKYFDYTTTVTCELIEPLNCIYSGAIDELHYIYLGSGATVTESCSAEGSIYWSTVSNIFEMAPGDVVYYDYNLTLPVVENFYSDGIYWIKTNLVGVITSIGACMFPTMTPTSTPTPTVTPTSTPTPTVTPTSTPTPTVTATPTVTPTPTPTPTP